MGNLRVCFAVALLAPVAACGSDHAAADASIKIIDAPNPDAKVFEDAPPPMYDLSCLNDPAPTTAADPITVAGTTVQLSQTGDPIPNVAVAVFKNGTTAPLATVTSDATGAFTTGNIATGTMPIDGYVRAVAPLDGTTGEPVYRSTYLYPPSVVATSLADVPVLMISVATFSQISGIGGGQDDSANGALFFAVTDCTLSQQSLIAEATVKVQRNGTDVGNVVNLGSFIPQLAGTFVALDVPDGPATITASYNGMTFPAQNVAAYKKPSGTGAVGTMTVTVVRPDN
jgi:hypothetical protein